MNLYMHQYFDWVPDAPLSNLRVPVQTTVYIDLQINYPNLFSCNTDPVLFLQLTAKHIPKRKTTKLNDSLSFNLG